MLKIKCKKCGNELPEKSIFCNKCGNKIEQLERKPKKETGLKIFLGFLILIVIYILWTQNNKPIKNVPPAIKTNLAQEVSREKRYAHQKINLRQGRGENFKIINYLERGDVVNIDSTLYGWCIVYKNNNKIGYASENFLNKYPIPDLEIADWNWRTEPDFGGDGAVIYTVQIRNNTNRYIKNVLVEITTYDSNGNLIDTDQTYVTGLSPGGTASGKGYATYYGKENRASIRIVE
ncbi:MAG TPA: DUF2116 family Zn-ribbon domain-containing protein [Candidatus Lokiarchaeia archaeon]